MVAAHPLEKWLGFDALRHDERHGDLFVLELAVAFGLVQRRNRKLAVDFVFELFWIGSLIPPLSWSGFG